MTAADLSGRDLDVACALAMGSWYRDGDRWGITGRRACYSGPVRYSADPTTLDEKLAWLRERGVKMQEAVGGDPGGPIIITVQRDGVHAMIVEDFTDCGPVGPDARGKNIHDATARLVVAVKEAMP